MQNKHRPLGVKILQTLDPYVTPVLITGLSFLYDLFTWMANTIIEYKYKRRNRNV